MQAKVYNLAGDEVRSVELDDAIFGIKPNMAVVHQAVVRQQANARQGTHDTKTRGQVRGGGRKPWRQKGTGRARQGSTRSPQWAHGGVVFGPHPRSYEQDMPRKMRRLAIRSVLSAKAADNQIILVDGFAGLEPRTRVMADTLKNLNVGDGSALIFTTGEENIATAAANLTQVKTLRAGSLSVVDMLKYDYLIMPLASLDVVNGILGETGGRRKLPLRGVQAGLTTLFEAQAPAPIDASANVAFETTAEVRRTADATLEEAGAHTVYTTGARADEVTIEPEVDSDALLTDSGQINQAVEAELEGDEETGEIAEIEGIEGTEAEGGEA